MISAVEFQNAYNDLYAELYRYIWEMNTVEKLADFEVAVYQVFPNIDEIRKTYEALMKDVRATDAWEDEDLKAAADVFSELMDSEEASDMNNYYADLVSFQGGIKHDN